MFDLYLTLTEIENLTFIDFRRSYLHVLLSSLVMKKVLHLRMYVNSSFSAKWDFILVLVIPFLTSYNGLTLLHKNIKQRLLSG